jgi:hypothetical protein
MNKMSFRCLDCNNILIPKPMSKELECRKCGSSFMRDDDGILVPMLSHDAMNKEMKAMLHNNPLLQAQVEAEEKSKAHNEAERGLLENRMNITEIKSIIRQKKKEYTIYLVLIIFFSFAFAIVFGQDFLNSALGCALLISAGSVFYSIHCYKKFKQISSNKLKELTAKVKDLEFQTYGDINDD